jgi:hypothetical protein
MPIDLTALECDAQLEFTTRIKGGVDKDGEAHVRSICVGKTEIALDELDDLQFEVALASLVDADKERTKGNKQDAAEARAEMREEAGL